MNLLPRLLRQLAKSVDCYLRFLINSVIPYSFLAISVISQPEFNSFLLNSFFEKRT